MFKRKFWLSLTMAIPALLFSNTVQSWLHVSLKFPYSSYIPALFGTAIFFYGGLVFLQGAKTELANRLPGMMTLISMAITVAFGYSLAVTLGLVGGMDFWWELATLVTIMLLGHWLEMASVMNAQGALHELAKLVPDEAERIVDGSIEKIAVADLRVGDIVLIRPGGAIPSDGQVVKGASDVNEAMITGESKPIKKSAGADVMGGTINNSGSLTIRVTKTGGDTALAGIMKLVAEAQHSHSRAQLLADKAAMYLTFVAGGSAILTAAGWMLVGGVSVSFILERVVTVLVIACPHALGLAVPLVAAISTTRAAQNGILIRRRDALEAARNIDVVVFDKTGTLTEGKLAVVGINGSTDNDEVLALAAAVETESEHAIASAIVAAAGKRKLSIPAAINFSALAGRGAKATVKGREVFVGGSSLIDERDAYFTPAVANAATEMMKSGKTVVYVIEGQAVAGVVALADVVRKESKAAVDELRAMGKRVAMLTGDNQSVAATVAKELGIKEYFAGVLPENKSALIVQLQDNGSRVAMVGDGINDAPALAQADVGIAIGAGTDVAIEAAGIILASSDPRGVSKIIRLSDATYRKMAQNLAWATAYNAIAIPLAAGVTASFGFVLSPAFGAILMSLSTIIVALNAQLLRRQPLN